VLVFLFQFYSIEIYCTLSAATTSYLLWIVDRVSLSGSLITPVAFVLIEFDSMISHCVISPTGNDEDVDIGRCLDSQGVVAYDTTDRFNSETFHGGTMEEHVVGPISDLLQHYPTTLAKTVGKQLAI
jgi:hypothetical protein